MTASKVASATALLLVLYATAPALQAEDTVLPNEVFVLPATALGLDPRPIRERNGTLEMDSWNRRWKISLAPMLASQALDAASSYGLRERNSLLAGSDGRFGMQAVAIKFGVTAGILGLEYLVVRKFPRSAKLFTIVNWTAAGATTGLAVHNYRLPGR